MRKFFLISGLFFLMNFLNAYELKSIADAPTGGILQKGEAEVFTKIYRENGVLCGTKVGLFPRFMFGVSYGGEKIVGNERPQWHPNVEFSAKFRIIDEGPNMPAIALGYDSQGHGIYNKISERYDIKSKGFYAVASRNYLFMGNLGFHAGINYSMENKDDKDIDFFIGFDKTIGNTITLAVDYDPALNDNQNNSDTFKEAGKGYLNAAIIVRFTDSLDAKFIAYDILENSSQTIGMDRAIQINYKMKF
jgi:hypothetical protein